MSIKETVESFIKFRRSIGRKDQSTTYSLRLFAKFIGETTELTSITRKAIVMPSFTEKEMSSPDIGILSTAF